jgi:hypothetical protein
MIISIDKEKVFNKIQNHFMISPEETRNRRIILQLIKATYDKPQPT